MGNKYYDEERQMSVSDGVNIVWQNISHGKRGARPETIIEIVLERVQYLNEMLPCEENEKVIKHLCEAISWEEMRNLRRKRQGVQGTWQPHKSD